MWNRVCGAETALLQKGQLGGVRTAGKERRAQRGGHRQTRCGAETALLPRGHRGGVRTAKERRGAPEGDSLPGIWCARR